MKLLKNKILKAIYEGISGVLSNYTIKYFYRLNVDDYNYIKTNKEPLFNFLNDGYKYANLGSFCGCSSANSLLKNFTIIKIAYINGTIIAVSVYTGYQDGQKCVGMTATTNEEYRELGKQAVIDIIKEDINLEDHFYWVECSGPVEHLYKKYNGTRIPNAYIELFIGNKFISKDEDGYHFLVRYKSPNIDDPDDIIVKKSIFGFNNKQTYDIIKEQLDASIMKQIDFINKSVKESSSIYHRDKYQAAHDIIYVFYDEQCQGVHEFDIKYLNILNNSIKLLKEYIIENPNDERKDKFEIAIWNGYNILDSSEPLELHKC